MNNFEDTVNLNVDERAFDNSEAYKRFLIKGPNCEDDLSNKEDVKNIKDAVKGVGKLVAVADGRRTMMGNHKYILFIETKEGYKVYLYTSMNGLYNEMGPYDSLDTAESNADCYGLFEEQKKLMNKKLFESIYEDDDETLGYDEDFVDIDDDTEFYDGESFENGDDAALFGADALDDTEEDEPYVMSAEDIVAANGVEYSDNMPETVDYDPFED